MSLSDHNIQFLRGVGPRYANLLSAEAEVSTYEDLLQLYPYKYVDRSHIYAVRDLRTDMPYVQLCGRFVSFNLVSSGYKQRMVGLFTDGTGTVEIVWFKGIKYIRDTVNTTDEYMLFGKPNAYGGRINIAHPELEKTNSAQLVAGSIQAFYNTSEVMKKAGLNSRTISKIIHSLFAEIGPNGIVETLPAYFIQRYNLMYRTDALRTIHFPSDTPTLQRARFRLKFEELFYVQLNILRNKNINHTKSAGVVFSNVGPLLNRFYSNYLPFEPTNAQKRVVHEIRDDMRTGRQMNRLVQGDVGSGKTLVALMAMLIACDNGFQACLMAPTEILATQHFEGLKAMLKDLPVRVELLIGSTKKRLREGILAGLADGSVNILIGTHALIEDTVVFARLGLAVIDEQHRFGVEQRARLWRKAAVPPHILVMTATPIPRTLAMTIYGDLDVSVIDELPPGRKPVTTLHYFHNYRNSLNRFIREQLQLGRQAYIVYPLIEESERLDFKNLTEGFEYMKDAFPEYKVCMVHGRMKPDEKDAAMRDFVSGQTNIMVATTVIEVGVNVPNASVMVIESAERFGLSQLHQLRGRVGRGAEQSYCILMTDVKLADESRKRMQIMTETNDGFEIAEADLRLRGPGSIDGTQQSGLPFSLHIADLAKDAQIVQYTREIAQELLKADSLLQAPENGIFVRRLAELSKKKADWSMIS
ncbi:MAG: ATP-dependent DNA helicase RecG [Bacteroidales bacterium]|nr:ATP-dependent DNA helicase RecG [Bacteroidales bacterium]